MVYVDFFFMEVLLVFVFFFFFQAEDGIRDGRVTGVQTCALPIWSRASGSSAATATFVGAAGVTAAGADPFVGAGGVVAAGGAVTALGAAVVEAASGSLPATAGVAGRSEERRVGKERRCGGVRARE